jgi:hypothetical protein
MLSVSAGGDIMHVDMNVFSAKDWKLSWLLLLPFVNYAKDWIRCGACDLVVQCCLQPHAISLCPPLLVDMLCATIQLALCCAWLFHPVH